MIEFNATALLAALERVAQASQNLQPLAAQVEGETLGHAVIGVRRNVYATVAGAYRRTHDLERSIQARARSARNTLSVEVSASEPYAWEVEFGRGPNELQPAQIVELARLAGDRPVTLGRTGQAYTLAGPFILPAAVYAQGRMASLFGKAIRAAL